MHFYLEAFCKLLEDNDIQTDIMSNFSYKNKKQYLPNVFVKSPVKKVINLFISYFKLLFAILRLKKNEYIILELYGIVLDIPLFLLGKLNRKRILVDVHEMMALDYKNPTLRKILYYLYKTCPNKIIAHSAKISNALSELSNKNNILFVPLFHYHVDLDYDIKNLGEDVINVFEHDSTYFLFFGNIRPSKGLHNLLAATELLTDDRIKIIIAGQDIFNKLQEYKESHVINNNVIAILRLINDDEMKYLFKKSHATLLPYESISQSAVLETAVNFKIPLITSNIDYFKTILGDFPSFGKYTDTTNPGVFVDSLIHFAEVDIKEEYYNESDMKKYYENDKFEAFIKDIRNL